MLNYISIMGRLVKDPELRYTQNQTPVTSFTVAVDRDFGEGTDFIDCVAWKKTGEFVNKYFDKGRMILVAGRLQNRDWTDKDGNKRRNAEIVADRVYFGESKKTAAVPSEPVYGGAADLIDRYPNVVKRSSFAELDDDGDFPF